MFWAHELPRLAPESHLPILLDQLVMRSDLVSTDNVTYSFDVRQMVGALLSRGIEVHGDAVSNERLYAWLGVDADRYGESRREKEHEERIAAWFEKRADRYRAVLGLCYEHCAESENIFPCLHTQTRRLRSVTAPSDIGIWHLDQASQAITSTIQQATGLGSAWTMLPSRNSILTWALAPAAASTSAASTSPTNSPTLPSAAAAH